MSEFTASLRGTIGDGAPERMIIEAADIIDELERALRFYEDEYDFEEFACDEQAAIYDRNTGSKLGGDRGLTARNALERLK